MLVQFNVQADGWMDKYMLKEHVATREDAEKRMQNLQKIYGLACSNFRVVEISLEERCEEVMAISDKLVGVDDYGSLDWANDLSNGLKKTMILLVDLIEDRKKEQQKEAALYDVLRKLTSSS